MAPTLLTSSSSSFLRQRCWVPDKEDARCDSKLPNESSTQRFYIGDGAVFVSERAQLMNSMKAAAEDYDVKCLETLFSFASAGDENAEPFATALALHKKLTCEATLMQELMALQSEAAMRPIPSFLILRRLFNVAEFIRELKYPDGILLACMADNRLQNALMDVARYRGLRSIFDSNDAEEVDLAYKVFGKLRYFPSLKSVLDFENGCASFSSLSLDDEYAVMLSHTDERINCSLTRTPEGLIADEYNNTASLTFFNILVCMGDKPAEKCQRMASHSAVLEMASRSRHCREEVYLQVMKQLTRSASPTSSQLGWELLRDMCDVEPPHDALGEFVRAFIRRSEPELINNWGAECRAVMALIDCKANLSTSFAWRRTSYVLWSVLGFVATPLTIITSLIYCPSKRLLD